MIKLIIVILLAGIAQFPGTDGRAGSPTYTVSLEYFSGRPSPTWTIEPRYDHYNDISQMFTSAKKGQQLFNIDNIPAQLGYRGFLVRLDESPEMLVLGKATANLQNILLQSAPKTLLSDKIINQVTTAIRKGIEPTTTRLRRALPKYPDDVWKNTRVKYCNNCYNYAVDKTLPLGTRFGLPGLSVNQPVTAGSLNANSVRDAAVRDKLIVTPAGPGNAIPQIPLEYASSRYLVALVVDPDTDFHWYRLDSNNNNLWSHKPGSTAVTTKDGDNKPIADPRTAKNARFGPDYKFVCFMTVVKNIVKVKGRPNSKC